MQEPRYFEEQFGKVNYHVCHHDAPEFLLFGQEFYSMRNINFEPVLRFFWLVVIWQKMILWYWGHEAFSFWNVVSKMSEGGVGVSYDKPIDPCWDIQMDLRVFILK